MLEFSAPLLATIVGSRGADNFNTVNVKKMFNT